MGKPLNFAILMGYAAHWIGAKLADFYQDGAVLARANLAAAAEFQLDILQVISDSYREAADAGLEVIFPADDLPLAPKPLLETPSDLDKLRFPAPEEGRRMSDRLLAIREMAVQSKGELPVMGWVEGALSLAASLRGLSNLLVDLVDRPEWADELLARCAEAETRFALAQLQAGADLIGLGDAAASQISPAMYRRYALPWEQQIFRAVKEHRGVTRLHICGNTTRLLADMGTAGADIIDLDWMVSLSRARSLLPRQVLCGNVDPVTVFLQGTPVEVRQSVLACHAQAQGGWIAAAGCEIPEGTPPANLRAVAETLEELSGTVAGG